MPASSTSYSSSNGGNKNDLEENAHREGNKLARFYRTYLNMGLRVAPVAGHDNHRANWGRHTAARTGIWAKALTPKAFVEAYKARRVFATEDNELAVLFKSGEHWMGETVTVADGGEVRTFTVRIEQMADTDTGEVYDEGPYNIRLWGDEDGPGDEPARRLKFTFNGQVEYQVKAEQGKTVSFSRKIMPKGYYYVHVRETVGRDADGEEADAWTAPIWFAAKTPKYVWSTSEKAKRYHAYDCWVVKSLIKKKNRAEGDVPPADKTKHNCVK